jgi:hypothetical protein
MKNKLILLAGFILFLLISSCEIIVDTPDQSNLKSDEVIMPLNTCNTFEEAFDISRWGFFGDYCIDDGPVVFSLIAGQHIVAGSVTLDNDADNLYVTYETTDGWMLQEVHLFVGALADVPTNKQNIPVPGKFPYKDDEINSTSQMYVIPLDGLSDCVSVFAHAVVMKDGQDETAWGADCVKYLTFKSFTVQDGWTILRDGYMPYSGGWCHDMGLVIPEDGDTYELSGDPGVFANAEISINDDELIVTITSNDAEILFDRTYLFYGTLGQLEAYGDCPDYASFPYKVIDEQSITHEIIIPF